MERRVGPNFSPSKKEKKTWGSSINDVASLRGGGGSTKRRCEQTGGGGGTVNYFGFKAALSGGRGENFKNGRNFQKMFLTSFW